MSPDTLKSWFSLGREVLGFVRDAIATAKEAREEKKARKEKKDNEPTSKK